ncbi:MAG: arsenate reductase [Neisseria sp.]|nr:arsenate reductase [Neisseria sp.]
MIFLYGIPNCDTVKKARAWLDEKGVTFEFQNFKTSAPTPEQLDSWLADIPLETLLNKRGTTWRALSEAEQAQAADRNGAIRLMAERPSLIKRPVLVKDGKAYSGFKPEQYETLFG